MSHGSSVVEEEVPVTTLFERNLSESSDEPPMEQWSSLVLDAPPPDTPKMVAFKQGLYDPGSGDICAKYIPFSDSDVLNHVYYAYPGIKDPGIVAALTQPEPRHIYATDGQELYLDTCKKMRIVPVRRFHRSLVEKEINLKYYCVNPIGVQAMCAALALNLFVKKLDLTSNFLSDDACYHIGQMLKENVTLDELVLAQCKIGPSGVRRVVINLASRTMELLDLSSTDMGDAGFKYLATVLLKGAVIKRLNLSNNDLTWESGALFADSIEGNNTITHLNVSWNKMYPATGSGRLLKVLCDNNVLTELDFSWNNLTTGPLLKKLIQAPKLRLLDVSNNKLGELAAKALSGGLPLSPKLHTLNVSNNPMGPPEALMLLEAMKLNTVKLVNLLMADILVNREFVASLREVMALPYRKKTNITHGKVIRDYTLSTPDLRFIVMNRLDFVFARANKKCKVDIALYFMEQRKIRQREDPVPLMEPRELLRFMKISGAPVDEGLIEEVANCWPGPLTDKGSKTIKLTAVEEFIKRVWPDKKLPPTPPPELLPPVEDKKKKKK
ncbi:uncharacterized protein isoform X2 [Choristoneura fumiferana]|uniref:uncharacterized protein isoform X2 n=1 Tax=Choristoneura fumiferana TaxID=7141 RepID=UPI003D15466A